MIEQIANLEAGFKRLLERLKTAENFKIKCIKPINNNRYMIVIGLDKRILIIYKREPFYNFGKQFKDQGFKGVGDSINVGDLKLAVQNKVEEIYTIFPNGLVYKISLHDFLVKSIKWVNKEGKEVRSISIHEYKKAFDL